MWQLPAFAPVVSGASRRGFLRQSLALGTLVLLASCGTREFRSLAPGVEVDLGIVSYNLRYASARDGKFRWWRRRRGLVAILRDLNCDIFAVQEAEHAQVMELLDAFPEYAVVYRTRGVLPGLGESNAIFYRKSRLRCDFRRVETRWLSATPKLPGSRFRGARQPRIATRARFYDRVTKRHFWVFNSHLEHRHFAVRKQQAQRLRSWIGQTMQRYPSEVCLLAGDLNDLPSSETLAILQAGPDDPLYLRDALATGNPARASIATHRGFLGEEHGKRIDYILVSAGCTVVAADVDERQFDESYPSDHVPLWARLRCDK